MGLICETGTISFLPSYNHGWELEPRLATEGLSSGRSSKGPGLHTGSSRQTLAEQLPPAGLHATQVLVWNHLTPTTLQSWGYNYLQFHG